MIVCKILEDDDIITGEEWCRPLSLSTMSGGHSDSYSFTSMYSGKPENNVKWVKAKYIFGQCWFNKPLFVLRKGVLNEFTNYEFLIGDIPKKHQLNMKNYNTKVYKKEENDVDDDYI
jgi:hypothetical protein